MSRAESARELVRQLARRGIRDRRVLEAMEAVPRDAFVPPELQARAWDDNALPIAHGQTISQPYIVAWMSELLGLRGDERVLEIGTGSGYQTAILSRLAREVVTVERIAALSEAARTTLDGLGVANVRYVVGDGTLGCRDWAPYDGILVTAGAPDVPSPLYNQLRLEGRLVLPVGDEAEQQMKRVIRRESGPEVETLGGCRFVPLIGDAGWQMIGDE